MNEQLENEKSLSTSLAQRLDERERDIYELENQNKCLERIRKDIVMAMGISQGTEPINMREPPRETAPTS